MVYKSKDKIFSRPEGDVRKEEVDVFNTVWKDGIPNPEIYKTELSD